MTPPGLIRESSFSWILMTSVAIEISAKPLHTGTRPIGVLEPAP